MSRHDKLAKIDRWLRWFKATYPFYFNLLAAGIGLVVFGLSILVEVLIRWLMQLFSGK
jgi:hypothetical protein